MNSLNEDFWKDLEENHFWAPGCRDIHATASGGCTVLLWVTTLAPSELVEPLIEAGSDVFAVDDIGRTCLHAATNSNRPDLVKRFIELELNPFIQDQKGNIPLDLVDEGYTDNTIRPMLESWMATWTARELNKTIPSASKSPSNPRM